MTRRFGLLPWRLVERILLVVGIACVGYAGLMWLDMRLEQARENRELDQILASRSASPGATLASPHSTSGGEGRPAVKDVVGRIEIPRLGLSAAVREGDDARTLRRAVGHIPGTSLPGEDGNAGFAAHRDTFFSRLKDIRRQDEISFTSPDGVHKYVVQETRVVEASEVAVLDPTPVAMMTLVTCYPFNYIGAAPQRFVVRAVRQDVAATTGVVATAATVRPATVAVRQTKTFAKRIDIPKGRVSAPRRVKTAAAAKASSPRPKQNGFARLFKAAARGLGFAPREPRAPAQTESPDPRIPGR